MIKRQSYTSWRFTYHDPEHAAREAYNELIRAYDALENYADMSKYYHPLTKSFFKLLTTLEELQEKR